MHIKYMRLNGEEEHNEPKSDCFLNKYLNPLWILTVIIVISLYVGGIFTLLFEEDFTNYSHAIEIDNFRRLIEALDRNGLAPMTYGGSEVGKFDRIAINDVLSKIKLRNTNIRNVVPLNQFESYGYTLDIEPSCKKQWGLTGSPIVNNLVTINIVVKSAVNNYDRRRAIRQTWYLNRTFDDLIQFKTVFIVGTCDESNSVPSSARTLSPNGAWSAGLCRMSIKRESNRCGDIIQSSHIDNYYNNTIKTIMILKWVVERCASDFTLAIDDDFVFEVDNFVDHLKKLISMEGGFGNSLISNQPSRENGSKKLSSRQKSINRDLDLKPDRKIIKENGGAKQKTLDNLRALSSQYLYNGYSRNYAHPFRLLFSKWYVSRHDYRYNRFPPFITGGAVLMSFKTVKHFYLSSYFARTFIFDDVYIGMLAYKLGFLPEHNEQFVCHLGTYLEAKPIRANCTKCIGVHGIDPDKLIELWTLRKEA